MIRTPSGPTPSARRGHSSLRAHARVCAGLPAVLAALLGLASATPLLAQEIGSGEGVRFGIMLGGVSTIGFTAEYFQGHRSIEVTVGTWSFHDLSVAVAAKEYLGAGPVRPFVGGGLWVVGALPREGGRLGLAAVLQAPIGFDWHVVGRHSVGLVINVNRALAVRRTDPLDTFPLNRRLVPLPGLYYRWAR